MLVAAFNNHPHAIVLPNAKDTLQVKDVNGDKVSVRKVLTQVGLGAIFCNIIRDNPTIKGKASKCALRYIISALGCVCRFTDSYKQMYDCTECVGLHTLHCLLQANAVSCTASLRLTSSIAHSRRRLWRRQGDGVRLLGNQRHQSPLRRAHAHNGVCMLCYTGSARHSSAPSVQ